MKSHLQCTRVCALVPPLLRSSVLCSMLMASQSCLASSFCQSPADAEPLVMIVRYSIPKLHAD